MKSATNIELRKAWWKKEGPDALKRSGSQLEKALEAVESAEAGLRTPDGTAIEAFEKALDDLESAAQKVVQEAKQLIKGQKDPAAKKDLQNTIDVLEKPLRKAIAEALAKIPEPEDDEDEVPGGVLADPLAHAGYLKRMMPKLKRKPMRFAVGLASNDPAEMRALFHPKKGGRGLGSQLKKGAGAKKVTFGIAGGAAYAASLGDDSMGGRTLVLNLEGKRLPGLAKRVKLFMRSMKLSAFGSVVIFADGMLLESADETDDDDTLEPLDLDTPDADEGDEGDAGSETDTEAEAAAAIPEAPPPPPPPPDPEAARLRARLAAVLKLLPGLPEPRRDVARDAARKAGALLEAGRLDMAEKAIAALEKAADQAASRAETGAATGAETGATTATETGPEQTTQPATDPRIDAALKQLGPRIKTVLGAFPSARGEIGAAVTLAREAADAAAGAQALRALTELLAGFEARMGDARQGGGGVSVMRLGLARREWVDVRQQALSGVATLKDAIRETYADYPEVMPRIEAGLARLDAAIATLDETLQARLDEVLNEADGARRAERAGTVRTLATRFRGTIASDPVLSAIDGTVFVPGLAIMAPMYGKLDDILKALGQAEATETVG